MPSFARIRYLLKIRWNERRSRSRLLGCGIHPGDLAIDCGANVGEVTALMRSRGAIVHAFEPNPFAFDALQKRFAAEPAVQCRQEAVSDAPGRVKLFLHEHSTSNPVLWSVGSSMLAEKANVSPDEFVEVPAIDLADYIFALSRQVKVVKIDIEGMECRVLRRILDSGAIEKIDRVFVETHDNRIPALREETESLRRVIKEHGLRKKIDLSWM